MLTAAVFEAKFRGRLRGNTLLFSMWWAFMDTYRTLCLAPTPEIREILNGLESVSKLHQGLQSFRSIRRMEASFVFTLGLREALF